MKAVLWDVDGTLLDFEAAEEAAIRSCFSIFEMGECTDEMLKRYSAINKRYWQILERGEMTKPQILVGRFEEFFANEGLPTEKASAFNDEYQIRLGDTICFTKNALETLNYLKGKVLQCAVTNGTKIAQDRKLSASGMDRIFDHIFISENVGAEKPSPLFFEKVFEVIGEMDPKDVIIVGDSLTSDIRGGNNAGIVTCWFNPTHAENDKGVTIDHEITEVSEVIGLVL